MQIRSSGYGRLLVFTGMLLMQSIAAFSLEDSTLVSSPDGRLNVRCWLTSDGKSSLQYRVFSSGTDIILPSGLGLVSNTHGNAQSSWQDGLEIIRATQTSVRNSWKTIVGERSVVPDNYNELIITVAKAAAPGAATMQLIVRAYNEGVAFRYYFPEHRRTQILEFSQERTQFNLPEQTQAFFTNKAQGQYQKVLVKNWKQEAELPLTLTMANGLWVCLAQAEQIDYPRMRVRAAADNHLVSELYGEVTGTSPFATPWRVILIAGHAGELLENNYLISSLNPPNVIKDVSWIKPGKVMREGSLSTAGAKRLVDFAAEQQIDFVHFDAGWYGNEYEVASDARQVSSKLADSLNIQEVVRYAASKGKQVLLYVNHRALERQRDTLFPLYKSWGVAGVKLGFVHTGSQLYTRWLYETVRKAAENHLMVDVHDEFYPTGYSRTYPNLMTQEGVHGNEAFPDATHNTILPFTRYIAGAADYTYCFNWPKLTTTKCHQLALPVIYFSPWQFLFWYGRPENYPDRNEIVFWKDLPTAWDETKVVDGMPGEYVAIARKKSGKWYLGMITNTSERKVNVRMDFLEKGRSYVATIYEDADGGKVTSQVKKINSSSTLIFQLRPSGGTAVSITPVN